MTARDLPGRIYEIAFLSVGPRVRGALALRFFRFLYPSVSVGPGARCWGAMQVTMGRDSSITIGEDIWMVSDSRRAGIALHSPCKLRTMAGAHIVIGDQVALNGTSITCRSRIEIGAGTIVAANVAIVDSDFHRHWPAEERFFEPGVENDRPVSIGRNVWIGMGSMVLKGATIGEGSIIGAGSVVSGAIPANVLAAGVPARVIRPLAPAEPPPAR